MVRYGKLTQSAIAAVSRLAEIYDQDRPASAAAEVARMRNLSKPMVAKVLSMLAQARILKSTPGPGGGYALARAPEQITFLDIARVFERHEDPPHCPFGPGYCGTGTPCPVHDDLVALDSVYEDFLHKHTFAPFRGIEGRPQPATEADPVRS